MGLFDVDDTKLQAFYHRACRGCGVVLIHNAIKILKEINQLWQRFSLNMM